MSRGKSLKSLGDWIGAGGHSFDGSLLNTDSDASAMRQLDLDQLIAGTEAGTRYCLVWISLDPTYGHLVTLDELGDLVTLRPLASGTHVDVYEVTAR